MAPHAKSVDELANAFEDAWRAGENPQIEKYLPADPDLRSAVLPELLKTEIELLAKAGRLDLVDQYVVQFPELREDVDLLAELIHIEFRHRRRSDPNLKLADYAQRFPEVANRLNANEESDAHLTATQQWRSTGQDLETRCPHCHQPSAVHLANPLTEVTCSSCGKTFALVREANDASLADSTVGRFKLLEALGTGSFGSVWKAVDPELDRVVAIKIPIQRFLDADQMALFLREARAAAQLRHPNIVAVHEVGREDDTVFIVSDFIDGSTLSAWQNNQPLSKSEAAKLGLVIATALHHAHEQGVIHRDLKPQNIMIDHLGAPHIMDFGLARREGGDATTTMTVEGQILGTPAFMSPEQAQGDAHRADRRSDIYSLGVLLFQTLTGELPFRGSIRMLLHQILHDEAPSPRSLDSNISKELETICLKCLEKSPDARYATAADVAAELQRFLDGVPILARPISGVERFRRWFWRNRLYAGLSAMVVVASLLGFAGVTWQLNEKLKAERLGKLAEVNSLANANPESIPEKVDRLDTSDPVIVDALQGLLGEDDRRVQLRARLALLRKNPKSKGLATTVQNGLLSAEPQEFVYLRQALGDGLNAQDKSLQNWVTAQRLVPNALADADANPSRRLNAAALLRDSRLFNDHVEFIVDQLLARSANDLGTTPYYLQMFRDCSAKFRAALARVFRDSAATADQRTTSAFFLAEYASNDLDALIELLIDSTPEQFAYLMRAVGRHRTDDAMNRLLAFLQTRAPDVGSKEPFSDSLAIRIANVAIALSHLGNPDPTMTLLRHSSDPSIQCHLIQRLAQLHAPPKLLADRLTTTADAGVRYALLLGLANYDLDTLHSEAPELTNVIGELYREDPDPGVHSAARLLLQRLGQASKVDAAEVELAEHAVPDVTPEVAWHVNTALQTMVELAIEVGDGQSPSGGRRRFAISATEVTKTQLAAYSKTPWLKSKWTYEPCDNCPAIMVTWSEAASYCNWLSQQEGIPPGQWCYKRSGSSHNLPLLVAKPNAVELVGYRMPTAAEWEFACTGGGSTARCFGEGSGLISEYAWWGDSTKNGRVRPVATKLPNQFGLFDMYGNAIEWCHDAPPGRPDIRLLRGLGAGDLDPDRTDPRFYGDAGLHGNEEVAGALGFRVAKTLQ